jgi:heptosyltransferase-3
LAFDLPASPRILVITMRRLGDVLLTTPLVHALRRGYADARIDMLVFAGTEGILAGNGDIDRIIVLPQRPSGAETRALVRSLWRRYDLAVSTQAGDRPTFLAFAAGRCRIGLVPCDGGGLWWKRRALDRAVPSDPRLHRVTELLRLADALGIERRHEIVVPQQALQMTPRTPYAVLHANPMYRIRRWTNDGWRALVAALHERGLSVVATGGPDPEERLYLDSVWNDVRPPVERTDGRLTWPELSQLLSGASVYIGPDTSMTHLAAAAGCPTVAIYGPASPHLTGPWPVGGLDEAWQRAGAIQHRGNVWVVQNPLPCMPCDKLGCERHLESYSRCLDELSVHQVLAAVDRALHWSKTVPSIQPVVPADHAAVSSPGS